MGVDRDFDNQVIDWVKKISQSDHLGAEPPGEFVQLDHYLHELRLFKSAAEIALMKRAADATVKGSIAGLCRRTQPGMMEYELEAELIHEFSINGARYIVRIPRSLEAGRTPACCTMSPTVRSWPMVTLCL